MAENNVLTMVVVLLLFLSKSVGAAEYKLCEKRRGCGLVDEQGHAVLAQLYEDITPFIDDRALIYKDGRWGVIDRTGEVLRYFGSQKPRLFPEGFVLVTNGGGTIDDHYE